MSKHALAVTCLLSLALAVTAFACDDENGDGEATATTTADATITETPGPDIRDEDLTQQPALAQFLSTAGGAVDPAAVIYGDVTEDGIDDAVVPVSSGGEGGNIALFVFGYTDTDIEELLRVVPETPLTAEVVDGTLQVSVAVYAPGDPLCCPSEIDTTTYVWDGSQLVPSGESE